MADLPHSGKQPAKRHEPSRLRKEYHPDLTDDERMANDQSVQVLDSQFMVPETQLEHDQIDRHGGDKGSDCGEPPTPAVIDKYATKKAPAKTVPSPLGFKLFSKDHHNVEPEVRFNFAPLVRKAPDNVPAKVKPLLFQPIVNDGPAVVSLSHAAKKAGEEHCAPKLASGSAATSVDTDRVSHRHPDVSQGRHEGANRLMLAPTDVHEDTRASRNDSKDTNQSKQDVRLSPAEPSTSITNEAKQPRISKKKRVKKAHQAQPRGALWPPSPNGASLATQAIPPAAAATVPYGESSQSSSLPTELQGPQGPQGPQDSPLDMAEVNARLQLPQNDHQTDAPVAPQRKDEAEAEPYLPDTSSFPEWAQGMDEDVNAPPHQSPDHLVAQFPHLPSDEPDLPMEPNLPIETEAHALRHVDEPEPERVALPTENEERQTAPRPELRQDCPRQAQHINDEQLEADDAEAQWMPHRKGPVQKNARQHSQAETMYQDSHGHRRPYRVEKPTSKKRVVSGPQGSTAPIHSRSRAPAVQNNFEQILDTLREAHIAEKSRKEHDNVMEKKSFEEVKILLQNQINQYAVTVAEWKDRYEGLNKNVGQLREKAKTNQKYVTGLQKDYEKLQKSVASQQAECKKILQEKITEVENEKEQLRRDFEMTLDTVSKGQRNLKQTVDDLYVRLIISESKRKDLAENISKQVAMYEEEKTKRNDVEKQLLSSVQGVQRQLGDHSTQLIEKLGGLQAMVENAQAADESDSEAHQCLVILRQMQNTPFLTTKDLEKAAGMLRFVHEGIGAKLDTLGRSVDGKTCPNQELQTFVEGQLQELCSEMLRFDEVVADSRKAQEANAALKQKVEAEQQHAQQLSEQIKNLQQTETELKVRQVQLECQLAKAKEDLQGQALAAPGLDKEITALKERLKNVEEERTAKETEIGRLERNMEKLNRKQADDEKSYSTLEERCEKLTAKLEQATQAPSETEVRQKVLEELQHEFAEKEGGYKNDIHRLSTECEQLKALIGEHDKVVDAANSGREDAVRELAELQSQLDVARKEKGAAETRASNAEKTAHDQKGLSSAVEKLKERLSTTAAELQSKVEEFDDLNRAFSEVQSRRNDLSALNQQQQAQISQHASAIEDLRQKHKSERDAERTFEQQSASSAVQRARNEKEAVQKEKERLQVTLQETQAQLSRLSGMETTLTNERNDLRSQNAELMSAKASCESELSKSREDRTKDARQHEETLDTLRRENERSEAALREAEAKIRRQDAEHQKKLEFDGGKYAAKVQSLVEEIEALKASNTGKDRTQQHIEKPAAKQLPATSLQNIHAAKNRKKVTRELGPSQKSSGKDATRPGEDAAPSGAGQRQGTKSQDPPREQNLFDEESQITDNFGTLCDDMGYTLIDPPAEPIEDTQNMGYPLNDTAAEPIEDTQDMRFPGLSNDNFIYDLSQSTGHKPLKGYRNRSANSTDPSSLSEELSSDKLEQLKNDARPITTPVTQTRESSFLKFNSSQDRVLETPTRSDSRSATSSHDRPRSQANTASRMMPPPSQSQRSRGQDKTSLDEHQRTSGRPAVHQNIGNASRRSQGHSTDFMHPPSSVSKHIYGQHDHDGHSQTSYRASERTSNKRKSAREEEFPDKKQRTSSRSLDNSSSGSVTGTQSSAQKPIRSPAAGVRSRAQASPFIPPSSSVSSRFGAQISMSRHDTRASGHSATSITSSHVRAPRSSVSKTSKTTRGPGTLVPPSQVPSTRQTRSQSSQNKRNRFAQEFR